MAELNDLFEEAASLSLDFAREVTQAVEAVTEMRANADKVQQKAETETAEVKKAIDAPREHHGGGGGAGGAAGRAQERDRRSGRPGGVGREEA